jgi:hypothetical protein
MSVKTKTKTQNTKQNSNRYFSEKSPKPNKKDEKIFAIMVNINNENTRKLIRKDNYEEIKDYFSKNVKTPLGLGCALFTKDPTPFQNAVLFYPEDNGAQIVLGKKTLEEICKKNQSFDNEEGLNDLNQFLDETYQTYLNTKKNKETFFKAYNELKFIPNMTEDEAVKFINEIPNKKLDEWIDTLSDSLYISNRSLKLPTPPLSLQTKLFNELLSHLLTVEFIYGISDELSENTTSPPPRSSKSEMKIEKFQDIKERIKEKPELQKIYDAYHMLKCMCFILHDKPVHSLAPFLLESFQTRISEKNDTIIHELITIYISGFQIQGKAAKVTQHRCHDTILNLTKTFNKRMTEKYRIMVPEIIKVFSVPYSAFKLEESAKNHEKIITEEIKEIMKYYDFGLGDAVGNDTFIQKIGKKPIYPDTLSQQDAAGTTHSVNELIVKECNEKYKIYNKINNEPLKSLGEIPIAPLHFLDISILCEKINGNCEGDNYYLYYASGIPYQESNYKTIPYPLPAKYHQRTEHGIKKTLFGVIRGKVSQNDTVFLLNGILDITGSLRNKKKMVINQNIWYVKSTDANTDRTIRTLLSTLTKEAGDQSKIQVVENLSRNGLRSYVATVDSFFSHSFINGGVIWKGGKVEIFIPQGFQVPNPEQILTIEKLLHRLGSYTYETLQNKIQNFANKIIFIIETILKDETLNLPDATILCFKAFIHAFGKLGDFKPKFIEIYNGGKFDNRIHSGIYDEISLFRRIFYFNDILELFVLLEDELYERFSLFGTSNLDFMISKYLKDVEIENIPNVKDDMMEVIEQIPLFYLMRNIQNIDAPYYKPKVGRTDKIQVPYVNELLKKVLVSKLKIFCENYGVSGFFNEYVKKYKLHSNNLISENRFDDTELGENVIDSQNMKNSKSQNMKNSKSQTRKRSRGEIQSQSQKGTKKIRLL